MTTQRKHHFYSHLVSLDQFIVILDGLTLSDEERIHLVTIIQSNIHYTIVDLVLSHLSSDDKKIFLHIVQNNEHKKTWQFLQTKTNGLEEKILNIVEELKKELSANINELKER